MRIGLFPGSFKPYHIGHHTVVEHAAQANDMVHIIASTADRIRTGEYSVSGASMISAWPYIQAICPNNCNLMFAKSPIRTTYEILGNANVNDCADTIFTVYADSNDMKINFPEKSRQKYFAALYNSGHVNFVEFERSDTIQMSGTLMRKFMATGQKDKFIAGLPAGVDGHAIWRLLTKIS